MKAKNLVYFTNVKIGQGTSIKKLMMKQHPLEDKCPIPQTKLETQKTELSHNIKKKINKSHLVITKVTSKSHYMEMITTKSHTKQCYRAIT